MKSSILVFITALICLVASNVYSQATVFKPEQLFTVSQLQSDFTLLRNRYEKKHPNLYLYTPKPRLDAIFDSLYRGIDKPMTALAFYVHITFLVSQVKDGHGYMLPSEISRDYYNKKLKFLPLEIKWLTGRLYVQADYTAGANITPGTEILSINGLAATAIFSQLLQRQVRDGNNQTYPGWIINRYSREYYSYLFGHPETFALICKTGNGDTKNISIAALTKDSTRFYKNIRNPNVAKQPAMAITVDDNTKTATLKIASFDTEELKTTYSISFKAAIRDYFAQVKQHGIQHLILDLRDNQGGDPENGVLLLSFLLSRPFTMIYKAPVSAGEFMPAKDVYTGKLYVLVNGGSFSCTGMVASCLQANSRGLFIGQETGGNKYILSGDADEIILPNTKIECQVSTVPYILRGQYSNDGHGIMPGYTVNYSIEDVLQGRDKEMIKAGELIQAAR